MSKKAAEKASPKSFGGWVDQRDLIRVHNSFTSEAVAQELLASLAVGKKKILWDLICGSLFSLSPDHAHVVVAEPQHQQGEPRVNGQIRPEVEDETPAAPVRRYGKRKKIEKVENEDTKENIVQLLPEDPSDKASVVLVCMKHFLLHSKDKEPANIRTVIDVLNHLLASNISGEKAVQVCELIWRKKWTGYVHLGAKCFQYMLSAVDNNNCKKADVKRLVLYKEVVDSSASWISAATPAMAACLTNKVVLSDNTSPALLSRFFMLNSKCIEVFHMEVKKALINQTKAEAKVYGQIYGLALSKAAPDLQETLKTKCLQDFIQKFINVQWDLKAQKMKPHGFLLEALLEELYYSTVSNAIGFKVLLEAYEPLLWRNLSSANALQRATSTKLLYLMYPIEPPNTTRMDQEILTNRQNEFILLSLEDPNHVVRLIAVKKIKNILPETWKVMPRPFRVAVCNALFNKLAFDKSSPDIRKEALLTICSFIHEENHQMCLFLSKFFKYLKFSIYDECKQVRKAMLQLLLALQNFRHPKAFADQDASEGSRVSSCWDVVALHELVPVMAMEETNSSTLKMCVELAFKSIHPDEPEKEKTLLNRVVWLIKQGQQLARNFYENSTHMLPPEKALEFVTKVINRIGAFYRDFDKKGKSKKKEEPTKAPPKGRKRKAAEMGPEESAEENLGAIDEHENEDTEQGKERMLEPIATSLRDPSVVAGLLDIVMVVWVKHAKAFHEAPHADALANFEATVQVALDFVFREWKDNIQVLGPVLYMGSMLPSKGMKKLLNFCVNRLKTLITSNGGIPDQEIKLLATGVCNWDSPDILLDMNAEWLAECIKKAVPRNKNKTKATKAKKPKEEESEVETRAAAGLLILEKVFTHPVAHAVIVKKSSKAMLALLKVTEGVKKVAEHRLGCEEPLPGMADDLIVGCFKRYVALINLIPVEGKEFNPCSEFGSLLNWAEKVLLKAPKQVSKKTPLSVELLTLTLRGVAISAHKDRMSRDLAQKVVAFCKKAVASPMAPWVAPSILCACAGLFVHGELVRQGRRQAAGVSGDLLEVTLPQLVCTALEAAGAEAGRLLERDSGAKSELRSNIEELYAAFYAHFKPNSVQVAALDRAFVKAALHPLLLQGPEPFTHLPYLSEFLVNEFQHSSAISVDHFWRLLKGLLLEGLGLTPHGRAAAEVFLLVVGAKWPVLLPARHVDQGQKLLATMAAEQPEEPHEDDLVDLNQSFMVDEEC